MAGTAHRPAMAIVAIVRTGWRGKREGPGMGAPSKGVWEEFVTECRIPVLSGRPGCPPARTVACSPPERPLTAGLGQRQLIVTGGVAVDIPDHEAGRLQLGAQPIGAELGRDLREDLLALVEADGQVEIPDR